MNQSALFAFYSAHVARTGEYHGWMVPETAGSMEDEYSAAQNSMACIDSSFRGRLTVAGKDGLDLLHRLSTNDLTGLRPGGSIGTILTTEKGRIVDFVSVFHGGDRLMLIVSPMMEEQVASWIARFTILEDVAVKSITFDTIMTSFIGPEADSFVSSLLQIHSLQESGVSLSWGNIQVIPVRLSHATEVHIVAHAANAERFWSWLEESCGVGQRVPFIGSSAYEAYRIAEGIPMTGNELVQDHNPYDVNLRDFISYTKGCYIGQEVIARLDTYQKVRRCLVGLRFRADEGSVDQGARVVAGGEEVGWVTSLTREPLFGSRLGLAVVRSDVVVNGNEVACVSGGREVPAGVYELPMRWPGV